MKAEGTPGRLEVLENATTVTVLLYVSEGVSIQAMHATRCSAPRRGLDRQNRPVTLNQIQDVRQPNRLSGFVHPESIKM